MGLRAVVVVIALAGCGRVSFDARGDGGGTDDGRDGASADALDALTVDPALLLRFSFEQGGFLADTATGHDATCTNCGAGAPGPRPGQQALEVDNNDCFYVVADAALRPTTALTFALWMRIQVNQSQTMFGAPYMSDTDVNNSFEMYSVNDDVTTVSINTTANLPVSTPQNEWHHVAGVYAAGTLDAYLDGALVGSAPTIAPVYTAEPFMIACDRDAAVEIAHFSGNVDEVRLYSRALSAAEIAVLAQ